MRFLDVVKSRPRVEVEGEVLIPGRALTKFAKGFPSKPVDIELVGTRVRFTCGSAHSELPAMQVDDYPALPSMPAQVGTIDSDVLSKAGSSGFYCCCPRRHLAAADQCVHGI